MFTRLVLQALPTAEEVQQKRALAVGSLRQLQEYAGLQQDDSSQWEIFLKGPLNA